jgi:hypothetical protein
MRRDGNSQLHAALLHAQGWRRHVTRAVVDAPSCTPQRDIRAVAVAALLVLVFLLLTLLLLAFLLLARAVIADELAAVITVTVDTTTATTTDTRARTSTHTPTIVDRVIVAVSSGAGTAVIAVVSLLDIADLDPHDGLWLPTRKLALPLLPTAVCRRAWRRSCCTAARTASHTQAGAARHPRAWTRSAAARGEARRGTTTGARQAAHRHTATTMGCDAARWGGESRHGACRRARVRTLRATPTPRSRRRASQRSRLKRRTRVARTEICSWPCAAVVVGVGVAVAVVAVDFVYELCSSSRFRHGLDGAAAAAHAPHSAGHSRACE